MSYPINYEKYSGQIYTDDKDQNEPHQITENFKLLEKGNIIGDNIVTIIAIILIAILFYILYHKSC